MTIRKGGGTFDRFRTPRAVASVALALAASVAMTAGPAHAQTAASCQEGIAVADPANSPGLISDCEALLAARDALAGTASLNWSAATPISQWEGVTVDQPVTRVTGLDLESQGLTGSIPPELRGLSNLKELDLSHNQLSGEIPSGLGSLSNLILLDLYANRLSGEIPPELGSLSNLERLFLSYNGLRGGDTARAGQTL